jgi:hypothetical protein
VRIWGKWKEVVKVLSTESEEKKEGCKGADTIMWNGEVCWMKEKSVNIQRIDMKGIGGGGSRKAMARCRIMNAMTCTFEEGGNIYEDVW